MHAYRTHTCAQLTGADAGSEVRLSGWVHNKRDHGGVLFVDLRDHYGITQVVADSDSPALGVLEKLKLESVVTIDGTEVYSWPWNLGNAGEADCTRLGGVDFYGNGQDSNEDDGDPDFFVDDVSATQL